MSDVARILKEARDQGRLTALDFAQGIFDDFIELHGDRNFRDDGAIIGGIGRLNGQAVTVVGIQKGRNLQDNLNRNFGQPHPEGYRKALRLMKQAEKFGRPVVTFINTAGAYPGVGAEERGQGEAIARNLMEMSDLKVPIIAIIIGDLHVRRTACAFPRRRGQICTRASIRMCPRRPHVQSSNWILRQPAAYNS